MPDTSKGPDPITLTLFANRFMGVAEAMGRMLQQTAISTNIKERLDFSCALFAPDGDLVANAPFIPIHLGAMSFAVKYQMKVHGKNLKPGDVLMSNSPSAGGSRHLPDITIISPVFDESSGEVIFFTASRGHHADVGGILPGSMPPTSVSIFDEGAEITSFKIVNDGVYDQDGLRELLLIKEYGLKTVHEYMLHIRNNAEQSVRNLLRSFAKKHGNKLEARDYLDDGSPMNLRIEIDEESGSALFDFEGTGPEIRGNLNAPISVVHSAVIYCMRSMLDVDIPLNAGCLVPIKIKIPDLSFLHPSRTAAVCAGNVLTSQRIVDVVLKAFSACAASQGCTKLVPLKSNLTFGVGGKDKEGKVQQGWGTTKPRMAGTSGIHTHITNTRIGDVEILERRYPVLLHEFSLRKGSGGIGEFIGGDGVIRDIEFLHEMQVSILSEISPSAGYFILTEWPAVDLVHAGKTYGSSSHEKSTISRLLKQAKKKNLVRMINIGGKATVFMGKGDHLVIHTPGGGGWGEPKEGGAN
ncbi:Hydantoinase B oxoprolinase [Rhizoctonia solani]|uniref:Hydantoinase B oxoprolinase n=1 Tax=Rhizoctonia solani TaxID=456999 RepID=A0A8H7IBC3_9AGAM|nr:Hydantoinase B oxoprolinase [Rhizoctonia solani]